MSFPNTGQNVTENRGLHSENVLREGKEKIRSGNLLNSSANGKK